MKMVQTLHSALLLLPIASALLLLSGCTGEAGAKSLASDDVAKIRALEEAYVAAWLANDLEAVLATFVAEPTIIPGDMPAQEGVEAVRSYWWPDDGSRTTITRFETTIGEIGGSGDFAYMIGRGELAFIYEVGGARSELSSSSIHLSVLERQPDGAWKLKQRMWHALR